MRGQLELAVISTPAKQVNSWKMVDCQADGKLSCPSPNRVQPQITLAPCGPAPWLTPPSCMRAAVYFQKMFSVGILVERLNSLILQLCMAVHRQSPSNRTAVRQFGMSHHLRIGLSPAPGFSFFLRGSQSWDSYRFG